MDAHRSAMPRPDTHRPDMHRPDTPRMRKVDTIIAPKLPRHLPALDGAALMSHDIVDQGRLANENLAGLTLEFCAVKHVVFRNVCLAETRFLAPRFDDVRFENCDLANAEWTHLIAHRIEFIGCRMDGFTTPEAHWQDIRFVDSSLHFARLRFATLKPARFEQCNLSHADFQASELSGASFARCNLNDTQFAQTKLAGADLRTSTIERIHIGVGELAGVIVDPFQASYLASLMGLVIKQEDEQ